MIRNLCTRINASMTCEINTSIIIDAPKSFVWDNLIETEHYQEWNPFLKEVTGEFIPGERITITMEPEEGSKNVFNPIVNKVKEEKKISWEGKLEVFGFSLGSIFTGQHKIKLLEISENQTEVIHGEKFCGWLVCAVKGQLQSTYEDAFEQMNVALKTRSENDFINEVGEEDSMTGRANHQSRDRQSPTYGYGQFDRRTRQNPTVSTEDEFEDVNRSTLNH